MEEYGAVKDGGRVTHITFPDNFMQEQETTISQIVALADDPDMKVILMAEAIPELMLPLNKLKKKTGYFTLLTRHMKIQK